MPYTRCKESLFESPRKYDAEFYMAVRNLSLSVRWYAYLGNHESFDLSGVWNVGANAEVNHRPTAVDSGG